MTWLIDHVYAIREAATNNLKKMVNFVMGLHDGLAIQHSYTFDGKGNCTKTGIGTVLG